MKAVRRAAHYTEWVDTNPLRVWMKGHFMPEMEMAGRIGISLMTLQRWLSGSSKPARKMEALRAATFSDIDREWKNWLARRP